MSSSTSKSDKKDDIRIGEHAAKQPLSGQGAVTSIRIKGFNGATFQNVEEIKKAI